MRSAATATAAPAGEAPLIFAGAAARRVKQSTEPARVALAPTGGSDRSGPKLFRREE